MNLSSGEKPPVASSSRSQTARSEIWMEGRRPASSLKLVGDIWLRRPGLTRSPPKGVIRFEFGISSPGR